MRRSSSLVPMDRIQNFILLTRGQKVMIDADLATMYRVSTKQLNRAVKRNIGRFPIDFMFQLTEKEKTQVIANCDHLRQLKFSPYLPYAFTEHGAVMLASVLNSPVALEASIKVVRAFVFLREMLTSHKELAAKLQLLENKFDKHDHEIQTLFAAIRQLMDPPKQRRKRIGFKIGKGK